MPSGVDADAVRDIILKHFNMSLGMGLSKVKGKVFRIGHLGDFNDLSLLGTLAQRLVRRLCPHCKRQGADGHWHPVGCEHCGMTGYKGRTGVYELMVADAQVQALIHARAPESEVQAAARAAGLRSMREDGERLVQEGVTSLEEVIRVTRD